LPRQKLLVPEAELLQTIHEVQRRRQRPSPATLPGLLASAERFVTVLPELDPYKRVRREPQIGPLEPRLSVPLPPPASAEFFAYLSAECPGLETLMTGLAHTRIPGLAYIRGASADLRGRLAGPGLEILDAPASLAAILPRVSLVIHHGLGLCQYALSAGRPQLLFPRHMEQLLTAQLVQQLGVGDYLAGEFSADAVTQKVQQFCEDRRYADKARAHAESVQARGPWDPLDRILDACCKIAD
jgi:UDP:flavonoid glycosyltransferase YjiC (YdhE family)